MHHLSFGRKEGRRLGNKNTIFRVSVRAFREPFFDCLRRLAVPDPGDAVADDGELADAASGNGT
jgi:hypothetical protein